MVSQRRQLLAGIMLVSLMGLVSLSFGAFFQSAGAMGQHKAGQAVQQVSLYIFRGRINGMRGVPGPDGKGHDVFVPSTFAIKVGLPVQVTVTNYDEGMHSFVASDLGLNVMIQPGKKGIEATEKTSKSIGEGVSPVVTTFTFTPKKAGVFRWYCALPCDAGQNYWAMGQGYSGPSKEGFMAGFVVVLAGA